MKEPMKVYEDWIRDRLPEWGRNFPFDSVDWSLFYLDGFNVMCKGERGGADKLYFAAGSEEELRYWQLERVCPFLKEKDPPPRKTWRYYRDHAEDGRWYYIEHRNYDYNAIEDPRLYGFERKLRLFSLCLPEERREKHIKECTGFMNRWFGIPHWAYDRERLCFVEISDPKSRHSDTDPSEEPAPGSVIRVED